MTLLRIRQPASFVLVGALAALAATAAQSLAPAPNLPVAYSVPTSVGDGWNGRRDAVRSLSDSIRRTSTLTT